MGRTLLVTNDFPPRRGGIEGFAKALADRLAGPDGEGIVVYTASMGPESATVDNDSHYPMIRDPRATLLPTHRVRRQVLKAFREYGCDSVLFASSVPLGLLAKPLRAAGATRIVAITHGHEVWYARLPLARHLLRAVAKQVDYLTAVSNWTRQAIGKALPTSCQEKQEILSPGVDPAVFFPGSGGELVRERFGLAPDTPMVVCPARAIACKGQDRLIAAWPQVLTAVPNAVLLIVGDGNYLADLVKQAHRLGLDKSDALPGDSASAARGALRRMTNSENATYEISAGESVVFVGSVSWGEVAAYDDAANVVAMPSRPRLFGLGPEGYPLVFMEAAATGKPVIVGRNGGAPEGTLDGISGFVVDPDDVDEIASRIIQLLRDPDLATQMGERGRQWVLQNHTWDLVSARCAELLGRG